jgi:hypothetical protein
MSSSTYISLFAVHQATTDVKEQIEFYKGFGFVLDRGYEPLEGKSSDAVDRSNID